MSNTNPGPSSVTRNLQGEVTYEVKNGLLYAFGVPITLANGSGLAFASAVSASLSTSQDNYAPTGYVAGITNCLRLTPSANININGIVAPSGSWTVLIINNSSTYSVTFPNLAGTSSAANQFLNQNSGAVALQPYASAYANYDSGKWRFA